MLMPFLVMLVVSLFPNEAFLARRFPLNQITLTTTLRHSACSRSVAIS